jgi:hypothetical protein
MTEAQEIAELMTLSLQLVDRLKMYYSFLIVKYQQHLDLMLKFVIIVVVVPAAEASTSKSTMMHFDTVENRDCVAVVVVTPSIVAVAFEELWHRRFFPHREATDCQASAAEIDDESLSS